jgi:hypothetical protein
VPKTDLTFQPGDYALVADRISMFYERYPRGRIVTQLVSRTDAEVTFRAAVYRESEDREPSATGWASERQGDGEINLVACLENTETSAIGRALANLGFTASRKRPSREEMEKADRARRAISRAPIAYPPPLSGASHAAEPSPYDAELQEQADAIARVLRLIQRAKLVGLRQRRAESFRARVSSGAIARWKLEQIEARLRGWVDRESRRSFGIVT